MIGSFVEEYKSKLLLFLTPTIHGAERKLLAFKFVCALVSNKQFAVCSTFSAIRIDARTKYAVFRLFSVIAFVALLLFSFVFSRMLSCFCTFYLYVFLLERLVMIQAWAIIGRGRPRCPES